MKRNVSTVTWGLLLTTVAVYVAGNPSSLMLHPVDLRWWQPATYALVHGNWLHITLNMLALLSFGPELERTWGRWRFLLCYVLCAVVGGLLQASITDRPIAGASGSLFGLFAAYAWQHPRRRILTIIPIPVPAWLAVALYVGLSVLAWAMAWAGMVAHASHVGGAVSGLAFAWAAGRNNRPN